MQKILCESSYFTTNPCIHGFKVCIKGRNLKRRTTILKHARFLKNLEVFPIFPPEPEPVVVEEEGEEGAEQEDE